MMTGRNDPCPCGSGKKYKKCCLLDDGPLRVLPSDSDNSSDDLAVHSAGPSAGSGAGAGATSFLDLIARHPNLQGREREVFEAFEEAKAECGEINPYSDGDEAHADHLDTLLSEERLQSVCIPLDEFREAVRATRFNPNRPTMKGLKKVSRQLCTPAHREARAAVLLGCVPDLVKEGRPRDALLFGIYVQEMLMAGSLPTIFEICLIEQVVAEHEWLKEVRAELDAIAAGLTDLDRAAIARDGAEAWLRKAVESPQTVHRLFNLLFERSDMETIKHFLAENSIEGWHELLARADAAHMLVDPEIARPYLMRAMSSLMERTQADGVGGPPVEEEVGKRIAEGVLSDFADEMMQDLLDPAYITAMLEDYFDLRDAYLEEGEEEAAAWTETALLAIQAGNFQMPFGITCWITLKGLLNEMMRDTSAFQSFAREQIAGTDAMFDEPYREEEPEPIELTLDEEISDEEWRRLYRAALKVFEMEPWEWMEEDDLFAVRLEPSGQMGFVSVMGAGGISFTVAVFKGDQGARRYIDIALEDDPYVQNDLLLATDRLHAEFGTKDELEKVELKLMKRLGIKAARGGSPYFRSWRPGYVPWGIDADECRLLTHALEQLIEVAPRFEQDPAALVGDEMHTWLVRTVSESGPNMAAHESREHIPPRPDVIRIATDRKLVDQVKRLPVGPEQLDLDVRILPAKIGDGPGRPRCAYGLLLVESASQFAHCVHLMEVTTTLEDLRAEVSNELMRQLIKIGKRPPSMALKTPWLIQRLRQLLRELSIELHEVEELPALDSLSTAVRLNLI